MAELLSTLSIVFYVVAILFFVAAVAIFIGMKIPRVFSDFTGRTAKKTIKKARITNEKSGKKFYGSSDTNKERGKLTETISHKRKDEMPGTGLISENKAKNVYSESTVLLKDDSTTLLNENGTSPLEEVNVPKPENTSKVDLKLIEEVMFVHSEEVIF